MVVWPEPPRGEFRRETGLEQAKRGGERQGHAEEFSRDFTYERPLTLAGEVQCRAGDRSQTTQCDRFPALSAHSWGMGV